ncbi:MAG: 1-deoxy-D-xylulose-5-phosphate reductoisomerase [Candidatus Paracaedibacteraceae bacterium]|nr:1-deoxy-D-xylulose-5-phosphate reductoisomerase [Candidatus Paracaedibacteraceae bacterium]
MRTIAIHGATGSIGLNAIDIIQRHPDRFKANVLTGGSNITKLVEIAQQTSAEHVAIADLAHYQDLKKFLPGVQIYAGTTGILEAACIDVDMCLAAITGSAGILPTYKALAHCDYLALVNKESIVAAGEQILAEAQSQNTKILPVDSEHNGLYQIFEESHRSALTHVTITASGGPFRSLPKDQFHTITKERALKHPNWAMGPKNTIDSATLMNKGLEYIEAALLFNLAPGQIKVVVHPQSIVHALSSYHDGTTLAHLGLPDMRSPISYALAWPERIKTPVAPLNLATIGSLTFEEPDYERFPCLRIAENVMKSSQAARIVMNAADEIAFQKFMANEIHFTDIPVIIQNQLDALSSSPINTIEDVIALDQSCRQKA